MCPANPAVKPSYLLDVFSLEVFEKLLESVVVGLNADRVQDTLDIFGGGALVATEAEEKVSCEMLHFGEDSTKRLVDIL